MGLGAPRHEAPVVVSPARVESPRGLRNFRLDLARALLLGSDNPDDQVVHVDIRVDVAQQRRLDESEGIQQPAEGVRARVFEDLDEDDLDGGVDAQNHIPAGVLVLQADLEATLWVAA